MLGQTDILEITRRILKLIPENPQILQFKTAWELLHVPGLWKLNDFQAYPLDLREMVAHRMALKVHLDGLFKNVIAAEKSVAARMKI